MRIRRLFMLALLALLVGAASFAQTSVGIILGEPTGLSAKQWIGEGAAFDVAVAWSFADSGAFYVHVDYQQHFDPFGVDVGRLLAFAGIGGHVYLRNDITVGIRIPLGLVYEFDEVPLEVFLELAPGINLLMETSPHFAGGLGVRYRL
jgi:hypothetical protein